MDDLLADPQRFNAVETALTQQGTIAKFEAENGRILGRMMITRGAVPKEITCRECPGKTPAAFVATFDFYDAAVGLAIYMDTLEAATGVWVTPQKQDAEPPAPEWIDFFIEKLMESIREDGSYGVPIYSFVTDSCDLTVVSIAP